MSRFPTDVPPPEAIHDPQEYANWWQRHFPFIREDESGRRVHWPPLRAHSDVFRDCYSCGRRVILRSGVGVCTGCYRVTDDSLRARIRNSDPTVCLCTCTCNPDQDSDSDYDRSYHQEIPEEEDIVLSAGSSTTLRRMGWAGNAAAYGSHTGPNTPIVLAAATGVQTLRRDEQPSRLYLQETLGHAMHAATFDPQFPEESSILNSHNTIDQEEVNDLSAPVNIGGEAFEMMQPNHGVAPVPRDVVRVQLPELWHELEPLPLPTRPINPACYACHDPYSDRMMNALRRGIVLLCRYCQSPYIGPPSGFQQDPDTVGDATRVPNRPHLFQHCICRCTCLHRHRRHYGASNQDVFDDSPRRPSPIPSPPRLTVPQFIARCDHLPSYARLPPPNRIGLPNDRYPPPPPENRSQRQQANDQNHGRTRGSGSSSEIRGHRTDFQPPRHSREQASRSSDSMSAPSSLESRRSRSVPRFRSRSPITRRPAHLQRIPSQQTRQQRRQSHGRSATFARIEARRPRRPLDVLWDDGNGITESNDDILEGFTPPLHRITSTQVSLYPENLVSVVPSQQSDLQPLPGTYHVPLILNQPVNDYLADNRELSLRDINHALETDLTSFFDTNSESDPNGLASVDIDSVTDAGMLLDNNINVAHSSSIRLPPLPTDVTPASNQFGPNGPHHQLFNQGHWQNQVPLPSAELGEQTLADEMLLPFPSGYLEDWNNSDDHWEDDTMEDEDEEEDNQI